MWQIKWLLLQKVDCNITQLIIILSLHLGKYYCRFCRIDLYHKSKYIRHIQTKKHKHLSTILSDAENESQRSVEGSTNVSNTSPLFSILENANGDEWEFDSSTAEHEPVLVTGSDGLMDLEVYMYHTLPIISD